jgi:hypothetical protein
MSGEAEMVRRQIDIGLVPMLERGVGAEYLVLSGLGSLVGE